MVKKYYILVALILLGSFARAADLSWHFSHIDDMSVAKNIMDNKRVGSFNVLSVAGYSTYAPFQFLLTYFLVSPEATYRDLLFWARVPSCLFSILGLFMLVLFYDYYEKESSWAAVTAMTVLAFSWEDIIMAKQAHNYALGVTACILLLTLFAFLVRREKFSILEMGLSGLALAVLSSMHYQILFLIPAFFIAAFFHAVFKVRLKPVQMILHFTIGSLVYLAGVFPLFFFFLRKHVNAGTAGWNLGPHGEFFFNLADYPSILDKIIYINQFFLNNFFAMFRLNTAFLPYEHPLAAAAVFLLILLLFGVFQYFVTQDPRKQSAGVFFAVTLLVWIVLAVRGKIAWSPTRHNLILLPLMAVIIAEGVEFIRGLFARFKRIEFSFPISHAVMALAVTVLFFSSFKPVLAARRDPFREEEISSVVQQYGADALITSDWTTQTSLMKSLSQYFHYYDPGFIQIDILTDGSRPYRRIAWINHRTDLTPENFESFKYQIEVYNKLRGRAVPALTDPLAAYRIIYAKKVPSDIEIDFSNATKNGSNGFYFYILEHV